MLDESRDESHGDAAPEGGAGVAVEELPSGGAPSSGAEILRDARTSSAGSASAARRSEMNASKRPLSFVHEAYDALADKRPDAVACFAEDYSGSKYRLTYAQLVRVSVVLASGLQEELKKVTARKSQDPRIQCIVGVSVPRCSPHFLPLLLAVSRVGGTAVFYVRASDGAVCSPKEQGANDRRNKQIDEIVDLPVDAALCEKFTSSSCSHVQLDSVSGEAGGCEAIFALLYTGGTIREKIAAVSHQMFLHEVEHYRKVLPAPLRKIVEDSSNSPQQLRVFCNTSLFWAASAVGQISMARGFEGAVFFVDTPDFSEQRKLLSKYDVQVIGVAPTVLQQLSPSRQPQTDIPSVQLVFTWGEKLRPDLRSRFSAAGVTVCNLLIATEYWLCLVAKNDTDDFVPVCQEVIDCMRLQAVSSSSCDADAAGEEDSAQRSSTALSQIRTQEEPSCGVLCLNLAGKFVTPGYFDPAPDMRKIVPLGEIRRLEDGQEYFNTNDRVEVRAAKDADGVMLRCQGRDDLKVKINGEMIDLNEVCSKILELNKADQMLRADGDGHAPPIAEADVIAFREPYQPNHAVEYHFFVVCASSDAKNASTERSRGRNGTMARASCNGGGYRTQVRQQREQLHDTRLAMQITKLVPRAPHIKLHLRSEPLPRKVTNKVDRDELRRQCHEADYSWPFSVPEVYDVAYTSKGGRVPPVQGGRTTSRARADDGRHPASEGSCAPSLLNQGKGRTIDNMAAAAEASERFEEKVTPFLYNTAFVLLCVWVIAARGRASSLPAGTLEESASLLPLHIVEFGPVFRAIFCWFPFLHEGTMRFTNGHDPTSMLFFDDACGEWRVRPYSADGNAGAVFNFPGFSRMESVVLQGVVGPFAGLLDYVRDSHAHYSTLIPLGTLGVSLLFLFLWEDFPVCEQVPLLWDALWGLWNELWTTSTAPSLLLTTAAAADTPERPVFATMIIHLLSAAAGLAPFLMWLYGFCFLCRFEPFRVVAWPVVFWCCIGHNVSKEAAWWCEHPSLFAAWEQLIREWFWLFDEADPLTELNVAEEILLHNGGQVARSQIEQDIESKGISLLSDEYEESSATAASKKGAKRGTAPPMTAGPSSSALALPKQPRGVSACDDSNPERDDSNDDGDGVGYRRDCSFCRRPEYISKLVGKSQTFSEGTPGKEILCRNCWAIAGTAELAESITFLAMPSLGNTKAPSGPTAVGKALALASASCGGEQVEALQCQRERIDTKRDQLFSCFRGMNDMSAEQRKAARDAAWAGKAARSASSTSSGALVASKTLGAENAAGAGNAVPQSTSEADPVVVEPVLPPGGRGWRASRNSNTTRRVEGDANGNVEQGTDGEGEAEEDIHFTRLRVTATRTLQRLSRLLERTTTDCRWLRTIRSSPAWDAALLFLEEVVDVPNEDDGPTVVDSFVVQLLLWLLVRLPCLPVIFLVSAADVARRSATVRALCNLSRNRLQKVLRAAESVMDRFSRYHSSEERQAWEDLTSEEENKILPHGYTTQENEEWARMSGEEKDSFWKRNDLEKELWAAVSKAQNDYIEDKLYRRDSNEFLQVDRETLRRFFASLDSESDSGCGKAQTPLSGDCSKELVALLQEKLGLQTVFRETVLDGLLDSIRLQQLTETIPVYLNRKVTLQSLLAVDTVGDLLGLVQKADAVAQVPDAEVRNEETTVLARGQQSKISKLLCEEMEGNKDINFINGDDGRQRHEDRVAMWFVGAHHQPMGSWTVARPQDFDRDALTKAVEDLLEKHEVLRACFPENLCVVRNIIEPASLWRLYVPLIQRFFMQPCSNSLVSFLGTAVRNFVGFIGACWKLSWPKFVVPQPADALATASKQTTLVNKLEVEFLQQDLIDYYAECGYDSESESLSDADDHGRTEAGGATEEQEEALKKEDAAKNKIGATSFRSPATEFAKDIAPTSSSFRRAVRNQMSGTDASNDQQCVWHTLVEPLSAPLVRYKECTGWEDVRDLHSERLSAERMVEVKVATMRFEPLANSVWVLTKRENMRNSVDPGEGKLFSIVRVSTDTVVDASFAERLWSGEKDAASGQCNVAELRETRLVLVSRRKDRLWVGELIPFNSPAYQPPPLRVAAFWSVKCIYFEPKKDAPCLRPEKEASEGPVSSSGESVSAPPPVPPPPAGRFRSRTDSSESGSDRGRRRRALSDSSEDCKFIDEDKESDSVSGDVLAQDDSDSGDSDSVTSRRRRRGMSTDSEDDCGAAAVAAAESNPPAQYGSDGAAPAAIEEVEIEKTASTDSAEDCDTAAAAESDPAPAAQDDNDSAAPVAVGEGHLSTEEVDKKCEALVFDFESDEDEEDAEYQRQVEERRRANAEAEFTCDCPRRFMNPPRHLGDCPLDTRDKFCVYCGSIDHNLTDCPEEIKCLPARDITEDDAKRLRSQKEAMMRNRAKARAQKSFLWQLFRRYHDNSNPELTKMRQHENRTAAEASGNFANKQCCAVCGVERGSEQDKACGCIMPTAEEIREFEAENRTNFEDAQNDARRQRLFNRECRFCGNMGHMEQNCRNRQAWIRRWISGLRRSISGESTHVDFSSKNSLPLELEDEKDWGMNLWLRLDNSDAMVIYEAPQNPWENESEYVPFYTALRVPVSGAAGGKNGNDRNSGTLSRTQSNGHFCATDSRTETLSFLSLQVYHSVGDAFTYYPTIKDLLEFYQKHENRNGAHAQTSSNAEQSQCQSQSECHAPAPLENVTASSSLPPRTQEAGRTQTARDLECRLHNAFDFDVPDGQVGRRKEENAERFSMRGQGIFAGKGSGISWTMLISGPEARLLSRLSKLYQMPIEILLQGIFVVAEARAGAQEVVHTTWFVLHRDGDGDVGRAGLYADWRDLTIQVPLEAASVLGTIQQLHTKIRNRDWRLYNPVGYEDRTICNSNSMDGAVRGSRPGGWQRIADGEINPPPGLPGGLKKSQRSSDEPTSMDCMMKLNIHQDAAEAWRVDVRIDNRKAGDSSADAATWVLRMRYGVEDAVHALMFMPTTKVHLEYRNERLIEPWRRFDEVVQKEKELQAVEEKLQKLKHERLAKERGRNGNGGA